jgi:Integrase core domain
MSLHVFVVQLVVCLLLSLALLWCLDWLRLRHSSSRGGAKCSTLLRLLKPRSPDDCPACRLASPASSVGEPSPLPVRPWREVKSRRGAPKRVNTDGFADGLNVYFYALTAHFGQWREERRRGHNVRRWHVATGLIYGQVKKSYRRRKLMRVSHVMRLGTEAALTVALQRLGFSGRLNTAFIERMNLTIRHAIAALARRTWATSQQAPQLLAHLEWWRGYYHFVRPHQSLRVALVQPRERGGKLVAQRYRQRTPAMAAGRTNRRWKAREVLSCPLPPVSA